MVHVPQAEMTLAGRRNWHKLIEWSARPAGDEIAARKLADALAALVSMCTPMHREVLASQYVRGAQGRMVTHPLPPGLVGACEDERRQWATRVLLDCVDQVGDRLSRDHDAAERMAWRARAERYTLLS